MLSGIVKKATTDFLFPQAFAPIVQEVCLGTYSLSASIFEVLTSRLCSPPIQEDELQTILAPATKIFDKFGILVKGLALDNVVDQMLLKDAFNSIVSQLSLAKIPQMAALMELFVKVHASFLSKDEIISILRTQANKFLNSENELLGFLLKNINRGSSIEEFVKTLHGIFFFFFFFRQYTNKSTSKNTRC